MGGFLLLTCLLLPPATFDAPGILTGDARASRPPLTFLAAPSRPALRLTSTTPGPAAGDDTRVASPILVSLYATTAVVQMLDVHSTLKALDAGAREANPLMKGLVSHRAAFVTVKAGVAAGLIYAGHRLSKRHRAQAAITLAIINAGYVAVIAHNYHVARDRRR